MIDHVQHMFEFLAWGEARQHVDDIIGADFLGCIQTIVRGAQPKRAEIALLDHIPFGKFLRQDGQHGF